MFSLSLEGLRMYQLQEKKKNIYLTVVAIKEPVWTQTYW